MKILYFTATGNNLYIAKRLGGEHYSIPKMLNSGELELEDEQIGIVFPVHWLAVPKLVEEFLDRVKLKSNYIFAVLSYGMVAGAAAGQLVKIGKRNGINFHYVDTILMVDNYLPSFDMEQQKRSEPKKNIEGKLNQIVNNIGQQKNFIVSVPLFSCWLTTFMKIFVYLPRDKKMRAKQLAFDGLFSIDNTCNGCGVCARVCPVDNIIINSGKPEYLGKCIFCLACTHGCPSNVIRLKGERSKARYTNKNVTLKELVGGKKQSVY